MTTISVYDPPMCCSTGICGTDVDQRRVDLAADPMQASEADNLPAILADGKLDSNARYPSRAKPAGRPGLAAPALEVTEQQKPAADAGCCGGAAKSTTEKETAGHCC